VGTRKIVRGEKEGIRNESLFLNIYRWVIHEKVGPPVIHVEVNKGSIGTA
jgi:hypothetical protein